MAIETRSTDSGVVFYRLTVQQFEQMIGAGVFPEGAHVELLGGMLVDDGVRKPPRNFTVGELGDTLRHILPSGWFIREEKSMELGRFWRPGPDLVVARGRQRDYATRSPGAEDVGVVIEVADTTYAKDRGVKWRRYAATRVPIYWIVNLSKKQLEVYTIPTGRGKEANYRDSISYGPDAMVPVVIESREVGRFAVRDILP